jgi:hypothetical protein
MRFVLWRKAFVEHLLTPAPCTGSDKLPHLPPIFNYEVILDVSKFMRHTLEVDVSHLKLQLEQFSEGHCSGGLDLAYHHPLQVPELPA